MRGQTVKTAKTNGDAPYSAKTCTFEKTHATGRNLILFQVVKRLLTVGKLDFWFTC